MEIYEALREARNNAGKSQEYMALELGIARKTVQNWESGVSEPSLGQALAWFRALHINPLPYLFQVVHTDMDHINSNSDIPRLRESLISLLEDMPEEGIRQLLYLLYGDHGSSPRAVLSMVTAHLQCPMSDRVTQGKVILNNYQRAKKKDRLTSTSHIQPNEELLEYAIQQGENADIENKNAYVL